MVISSIGGSPAGSDGCANGAEAAAQTKKKALGAAVSFVSVSCLRADATTRRTGERALIAWARHRSHKRRSHNLFAGALVSAILSTVDSTLLAASALVSHNLVVSFAPDLADGARFKLARAGVVVFGIAAYLLALHAEGVYRLVEGASAFGGAGVFVVVIFGLFTPIGGAGSGLAALVAGASVWIAAAPFVGFPFLASLAGSLVAYLAGAGCGAIRGSARPGTAPLDASHIPK